VTFVYSQGVQDIRNQYGDHDPLTQSETSFGEVFAASFGTVADEEMSSSSMLNTQGYRDRENTLKDMVDGGFDVRPYQDGTGVIDYDAISLATDGAIKTDLQLFTERRDLLAKRRAYSEDVVARGNGLAQFVGSMTGYMLDPLNVVTLPLGAPASVLRGLSTMAQVGRIAATEAAIGAATELAIQPLVFKHKNEIGSPYEVSDAISAILTTAVGGAALGGVAGGIAGLLRRSANLEVPGGPEVQGARDILNRAADDLEMNPERGLVRETLDDEVSYFSARSTEEITQEVLALRQLDELTTEQRIRLEVAEAVAESRHGRWRSKVDAEIEEAQTRAIEEERVQLLAGTSERLSRGERKQLRAEIDELRKVRGAITEPDIEPARQKGVPARKAKAEAQAKAARIADGQRAEIDQQIEALQTRLGASQRGQEAEADLTRLDHGIYTQRLRDNLARIEQENLSRVDADYMRQIEEARLAQASRAIPEDTYGEAVIEEAFDSFESADLARYESLDDGVVFIDGEMRSAKEYIAEQDEIIDGLEAVRVCALG